MAASQRMVMLPADLKRSNRMQVLEVFKDGNVYTANRVAELTGVSRQTVMKAILSFVDKGLLISQGKSSPTNACGKPPELFSLSTRLYLLSVSMWPDRLSVSLMNLRGEVLETRRPRTSLPDSARAAAEIVGDASRALMAGHGVAAEQVRGVCVSTSGTVNYRDNTLKFNSLQPSWGRNLPIAELLAPYFAPGTPILMENVAKVVGRSILHREDLRGRRAVVVFSSWGGVCASFIENDRILNGKDSLIGEIGHMTIAPDDPELCGCGSHGCFERMVSNERLRKNVAATIGQHPESSLNRVPTASLTVADVFAASAEGDAYARELVAQLARYFAMALRNASLVFDPELIFFHGDYAAADAHFLDALRRDLAEFHYYPEGGAFALELDPRPIADLNLRGAHVLLVDHLFSAPELYE